MGKLNLWKIFLSAICLTIVAQIIHTLGAAVGMSYYLDPNYFSVWSKIMMPAAGPPPLSFYYYSLLFGFIGALLFAWVYTVVRSSLPGQKGLTYGLLIFLVGGLPGMLSMYLLINLPAGLIAGWAIEGLIINLAGGMIVERINP